MVLKYSTPHKCKFSVAEVKTTNDKSKGIVEPTTIMIANFGQLDQDPPVHKQLRNQREKVDDYHEPSIVKHLNGLIKSPRRANVSKWKTKAVVKVNDRVSNLATNLKE